MRDQDITYINEARSDYAGFVFAPSRRQVSPAQAERLRQKLDPGIIPVGVFVNAPIAEIAALHRSGIIDIAQLHGTEDEEYIVQLKDECGVPVIKVIFTTNHTNTHEQNEIISSCRSWLYYSSNSDYYLFDSGAGSGKTFDWDLLGTQNIDKPWFLAGGINLDNIEKAMAFNPFAVDISSGAETEGVKNREKILELCMRR